MRPNRIRTASIGALSVACFTALALLAPAAEAADSLTGTITWTRTATLNQTTPFLQTGTETTTGSLTVALAGVKASSKSGQGIDRSPKVKGTFTANTTSTSNDGGNGEECVQVASVTGVAVGPNFVAGTVSSKGAKKILVLNSQPQYQATSTETTSGNGGPRCTPLGTSTRTYTGNLSPNPERSTVCLPAGSASAVGSPVAFTLVGLWNAKKKAYVFDCTATYPLPFDRGTATVRIKGSIR